MSAAASRERLHDEVGQVLSAIMLGLGNLRAAVELNDREEALSQLQLVQDMTQHGDASVVRNHLAAAAALPTMLDDLGLLPALKWLAREVSRTSGIHVEVVAETDVEELPEDHRTCVYRVVQEAFHNAVRHSGAQQIQNPRSTDARPPPAFPIRGRRKGLYSVAERRSGNAGNGRAHSPARGRHARRFPSGQRHYRFILRFLSDLRPFPARNQVSTVFPRAHRTFAQRGSCHACMFDFLHRRRHVDEAGDKKVLRLLVITRDEKFSQSVQDAAAAWRAGSFSAMARSRAASMSCGNFQRASRFTIGPQLKKTGGPRWTGSLPCLVIPCLLLASPVADEYLCAELVRHGDFDVMPRSASQDRMIGNIRFAARWFAAAALVFALAVTGCSKSDAVAAGAAPAAAPWELRRLSRGLWPNTSRLVLNWCRTRRSMSMPKRPAKARRHQRRLRLSCAQRPGDGDP